MAFKTINVPTKSTQLIQDNVSEALVPFQNSALVGGNLLTSISLVSGQDNLVAHKLDTTPTMFIITSINADSNVWTQSSPQLNNSNANGLFINLRTTTSCSVSVWVK